MQPQQNLLRVIASGLLLCIPRFSLTAEVKHITHWNADWGPQPDNVTDFTTFLWYGYSSNKFNFTQEDFKAFVECTTGRRQCPTIDKDLPLSKLTDCNVNRALSPSQCNMLKACTDGELLKMYGIEDNNLSVDDLQTLLPLVLYRSQLNYNCDKENSITQTIRKPKQSEVWGYGLLFVTLISGCSLAGVSVLPLMAHTFYQQLLTLLVGLAVGSLAASSLFHLLPQAFKLRQKKAFHLKEAKTGPHGYLFISLHILLGTWCFFMIERLIKIILTHHALKEEKKKFPTSRSDQAILNENGSEQQSSNKVDMNGAISNYKQGSLSTTESFEGSELASHDGGCGQKNIDLIYASQEQAIKASFGHSERPQNTHSHNYAEEFKQGEDSVIKTVAWMIIFGDGFHNFIDGVSIGAAFSESILTGISISLAVMCEELPHELGDFAVLLNAGMTMKQAVSYNFLSATTCYLGLIFGICLGEFTQDTTAIFALAAGMFLYIALVDMVPEMNEVANKAAEEGWKSAVIILLLQNLGIFIGVALLFILAYFQDAMVLD
ncbi:metal cation symporter ZIP14-like isoform X1 [Homarus americanus]|uniref:metal cation symporter ZIP14-like isoform X1 n=1 Tax=Homarus americanus TaxID=6706 RepID=UPI001C43834B|nr:metal cation symporter ZIP14-like isoform X1 [Homarus americanus]XP_042213518.1 metal cation symporter ZIP14-like isoform X1 [Homarus americanus]